jgi:general stress protein 26
MDKMKYKKIPESISNFLKNQRFTVISTIEKDGSLRNACKGIVRIGPANKIYLLDLYKGNTYENIKHNANISITAVDEHKFIGYCLKGRAKIIKMSTLKDNIIKSWEETITSRITHRIIKNMKGERGHPRHPEALLPQPEYMILVEVSDIIDLTPHHIKLET